MTDKIIALVDGSAAAAAVCDHAAWAAARMGLAVELVHVLGPRGTADRHDHSGAIALGARSALLAELAALDAQRSKLLAQHGRAILDDAQARLAKAGVRDITTRLRHGDVTEAITDLAGEARLILLGKRGETSGDGTARLGSNLERLLRAGPRPVLVVARAFRPVQKVLVAFDGGAAAQRAVDHIAGNPLFAGLPVHLVTVGAETPTMRAALAQAQSRLQAAGLTTDSAVVAGQPDVALAALIATAGFDLLVMGAYGHSRIRSLIIGSTTTAMLQSCAIPVLLLR